MLRTATSFRLLISLLIATGVAGLAAALVLVSPSGSASGVGPAGGGPTPTVTPVADLTGIICVDVWLDLTNPPPIKGNPHETGDQLATKIMSRIEPSSLQQGGWDVTSVAYTGPGALVPEGPPSAEDCKTKEDGNSLVAGVDYQPVDNDRPTAIGKLVQKGAQQNLEYVICQQEVLPGLGLVWVRSEFALVVDGLSATQDYGVLTAYLDVTAPNDPQDPYDTSCGTDGTVFNTVLEATQRVATKGAPLPATADDWDGDGCSDWRELRKVGTGAPEGPDGPGKKGDARDPFNPYDFYDVDGDHLVTLQIDILEVIKRFQTPTVDPNPDTGAFYAPQYDRGLTIGPNSWNKKAADNIITLQDDILGVILQFGHSCA